MLLELGFAKQAGKGFAAFGDMLRSGINTMKGPDAVNTVRAFRNLGTEVAGGFHDIVNVAKGGLTRAEEAAAALASSKKKPTSRLGTLALGVGVGSAGALAAGAALGRKRQNPYYPG